MSDDDLKALLASLIEAQKQTEIQLAKTDAQMAKTNAQMAKTDAQMAKTDAQMAKTDIKFAELAKAQKQAAAQFAKTELQIDRTCKEVGNLGRGRGEIAEEFFYQSLRKQPRVGGIEFDHVYRHWAYSVGDISDEYDVILVNGDQLLLVEVKARADINDMSKLIKRKIPNFRLLFPSYNDYKVLGAMASLTTSDELIEKAKELGIFFLTQQGEHVVLVNDKARFF